MLKSEELIRIEYYLHQLQCKLERKLEDNRIPPLKKGLIKIYDEQIEELKNIQEKIWKEINGE